jgi:hypothetical protein
MTKYDVDILRKNGATYTYTVSAPTVAHAIKRAIRIHGNIDIEWAGNVRLTSKIGG